MRGIRGYNPDKEPCRCHISPPCNACVTENDCPNCEENVDEDLNTCPECGTELEPKE
jgi:zinc ribbon protein